jgi:hydrogenase expression/formation protein HypD
VGRLREALEELADRPMKVMEVCGTHTVSIFRAGLRSLFPEGFRLISGPGCPVCVTDQAEIDAAVGLAGRPGITVATYGDMLRVPGSGTSLTAEKARGADALELARSNPDRQVVFLGVGFETTAPATASVLKEARRDDVPNFSVLSLHKTVPEVLELLASDPELELDGFLLPGHVSVITGLEPFRFLPERHGLACAVGGFEPDEIMMGLVELALQIRTGRPSVKSLYGRAVRPEGNRKARRLLSEVFVPAEARWRGLGAIPGSGLSIGPDYRRWDALEKLQLELGPSTPPPGCRCGEVLAGKILPPECPLFGTSCTSLTPVGPCMVSSEGSCSAYYKYQRGGRKL